MENISKTIQIQVYTRYLDQQSDPGKKRFVFAYSIEITNNGTESVKLLNRHWHITDDNNKVEEVVGEGVIGQQPEIEPGKSFNYTSGAVIETEFGTMHGSYEMETANGEKFQTPIPAFLLSLPHTVH
ncbi:MAG: Co2+/Mg2+ efflux protein ApaG [Gammaproteobacteria bacterium]|nr:Co2+/Mg2+ efflux protein ApaG [Gammaproteobacteria bacterium]MDD9897286.1 Co2+/Mg2+ efflux protein ApaG [Gammaproteobacteria bacterium]MDD9959468.1 Co2+/Mg2+ efflux protein ApaG [Gammaproteobacteria bacterium]